MDPIKIEEDDYYVPDDTIWQRFMVLGEALVQLQKDARALHALFKADFNEFPSWMKKFTIMNNTILEIKKIPGMAIEVEKRLLISDEMAQLTREIMPVIQKVVEEKGAFLDYAFALNEVFNGGVAFIKEREQIQEIDSTPRENKLIEMEKALDIGKEQYNMALHQHTIIKENMDMQIKLYKQTLN